MGGDAMGNAFVFTWQEDPDGLLFDYFVVVIAPNPSIARKHLLNWLQKNRSEWRRSSNSDVAKTAKILKRPLKSGVLASHEVTHS